MPTVAAGLIRVWGSNCKVASEVVAIIFADWDRRTLSIGPSASGSHVLLALHVISFHGACNLPMTLSRMTIAS